MREWVLLVLLFSFPASGVFAETTLTYQYDANGNLIQGEGKYYEYNDANQLVKVRYGDQNGPVIAEYVYDYTGRRVKKIEDGVTTYYVGKHFEEQTGGSRPGNTSYYFANEERVAKKLPSGSVTFYHSDHLGGTNVVTNSSGNMIERIKYYPFGEIREGGDEKYTYTGKEKDKSTDSYYYEARYYNPMFKHFTQADNIESDYYNPQDLNKYSYVSNNPMSNIDYDGHSWLGAARELGAGVISTGGIFFNTFVGASMPVAADLEAGNLAKIPFDFSSGIISGVNSFNEAQKHLSASLLNLYFIDKDVSYEKMEDIPIVNTKFWKTLSKSNDYYSLLSDMKDIRNLDKTFHFNRNIYLDLVHKMGARNYSLFLRMINENKIHDAYKILKTIRDAGRALDNATQKHDR